MILHFGLSVTVDGADITLECECGDVQYAASFDGAAQAFKTHLHEMVDGTAP